MYRGSANIYTRRATSKMCAACLLSVDTCNVHVGLRVCRRGETSKAKGRKTGRVVGATRVNTDAHYIRLIYYIYIVNILFLLTLFFVVLMYAKERLSHRRCVCLSVCHTESKLMITRIPPSAIHPRD